MPPVRHVPGGKASEESFRRGATSADLEKAVNHGHNYRVSLGRRKSRHKRKDWLEVMVGRVSRELTQQHVRLAVLGAWPVCQQKVQLAQKST